MARLRLIHWHAGEARERARVLRAAGHTVSASPFDPKFLSQLRQRPPDALLIDLTRLPSHGRDVAMAVRESKSTRSIPIVFVGGDPDKVERTRQQLPDAVYASWRGVRGAVRRATADLPSHPVVPSSRLAGYSGTPLPRKLGVKPGSSLALVGAPDDFDETLSPLPDGVVVRRSVRGQADVVIWFVRELSALRSRVRRMGGKVGRGRLWIAWPKKASGVETDVTQNEVRREGLAVGLVDFKICAIDATWSGLCFTARTRKT